jgi:1-phosphofructokinase family hexose kinase
MRLLTVAPNPAIDRLYELDRLNRGAINRPRTETLVAGGKGLNVARAAVALGAEVSAVALFAGYAGRWMADTLAAEGIPGRWAWADGETRTCLAIHDATDDSLTELNEAGPLLTAESWAGLVAALRAELEIGDVGLATISGSLPPGAPADGLTRLATCASEAGVPVALDSGGAPLRHALDVRPWLVKLNVAEAAATLGRPTLEGGVSDEEVAATTRGIAAISHGAVVITRGLDGAIALGPDGSVFRVGPPTTHGSYPVGSGDAFLAGLAQATIEGRPFVEALRLGSAAAGANALLRGAGRLDPADVVRLSAEILIEPMSA